MLFLVGELLCRNRVVIIEHNSKHLSSVTNEVYQIIHAINIQKSDFLMA